MINQAIVLAAGKSSRFFPFSNQHKSQTILLGKPIIFWTLAALEKLPIQEIIVVINPNNQNFEKLLHSFPTKKHLQIVYQQEALGQANAILAAKDLIQDRFLLLNSTQVDADNYFKKLNTVTAPIVLAVKKTTHPELYGIVEHQDDQVTKVIEKPKVSPQDPKRIMGIYLLNKELIEAMAQMPQDEYLLETVLNDFAKKGQVKMSLFAGISPTLKYPWHLLSLKTYLLKNHLTPYIDPTALIAKTAQISGNVFIGKNAIVGEFACLEGPAYLGEKAVLGRYSLMRKFSVLESGAEAQAYVDISNSLMLPGSHLHSGFLGDSVVGENARIGADFCTANKRFDRQSIKVPIKAQKIDSKLNSLGALIGPDTKIGVKVATMPGTIISQGELIQPGTIVNNFKDK